MSLVLLRLLVFLERRSQASQDGAISDFSGEFFSFSPAPGSILDIGLGRQSETWADDARLRGLCLDFNSFPMQLMADIGLRRNCDLSMTCDIAPRYTLTAAESKFEARVSKPSAVLPC